MVLFRGCPASELNIGLFDEGGLLDLPNPATAKLAGYWRSRGAQVSYNRLGRRYDLAVMSVIFAKHWRLMRATLDRADADRIVVGGTGYALATKQSIPWPTLPPEVEATEPDWSLWPEWPWSLGFSYRGCPRACDFCVVPRKEGQQVVPVVEHYQAMLRHEARRDPKRHHLIDLTNNILAAPEADLERLWREVHSLGITLNYSQGLDFRLINQAMAEEIARLPLYIYRRTRAGRWRKDRRLYLALDWNTPALLDRFEKVAGWLLKAGVAASSIYVYVLERPGQEDDALERVRFIHQLGLKPYVMPPNAYRDTGLRRWTNRRYYQFVPWSQYRYRRQTGRQLRMSLEM